MAVSKKPVDTKRNKSQAVHGFLCSKGDMGELIQAHDWSKTPLGPLEHWPQTLKITINIMLQSPVAMVLLCGEKGVMIYNDAYSVFAGARHPSLLGQEVMRGWPEVADFIKNIMEQCVHGKNLSYKDQQLTLYRNGVPEEAWLDLDYSPVMDEWGASIGVLAILTETTQRVLSERAQEAASQQIIYVLESMKDAMFMLDKDWNIMLVNGAHERVTHTNRKELIGKYFWDVFPAAADSKYWLEYHKVMKTRKPSHFDEYYAPLDLWTETDVYPTRDGGISVFFRDITISKKARNALKESEERFRIMADAAPNMIWAINPDGSLKYINKYALRYLGTTLKEFVDKKWAPYIHPDDMVATQEAIFTAIQNKKPYKQELRLLRNDGMYRWHLSQGAPSYYQNGELHGYVGSVIDTHDLKQAEEALRRQLQITEAITDNTTVCLFMIDRDGAVTYANPAVRRITGYSSKEAIGKPLHALIHHSRQDGSPYPDKDCPLDSAYQLKKPIVEHEDIFFRKDGTSFPALISVMPVKEVNVAQPESTIVELRDITEEKRALEEQQRLASVTHQRNELIKLTKAKDEFIGIASHQLRTPATAVKQYIGILMDGLIGDLSEAQKKYLQIAYNSNERGLSLVDELLKTAQLDATDYKLHRVPQDIAQLLKEVVADLRPVLDLKDQPLIVRGLEQSATAAVDATEIKLALSNLIENASKYSPIGAPVVAKLSTAKDKVMVEVTDKGVGITAADQDKIFDKFTRVDNELSDTVTGTGLGLYWVKQIVELHGGSIKVVSKLKGGSTFSLELPL